MVRIRFDSDHQHRDHQRRDHDLIRFRPEAIIQSEFVRDRMTPTTPRIQRLTIVLIMIDAEEITHRTPRRAWDGAQRIFSLYIYGSDLLRTTSVRARV